jgi:selT/selW/selH-like putative selenoprotein
VSDEISEAIGIKPELVKGSGGVFDVNLDGKLIFSKSSVFRFPKPGEISGLLKNP